MAIPTHRDDCETKCWRTTCPDCKKAVYFLSCTCGSKVFFDNLGPPWQLHSEKCPTYFVRQMVNDGVSPVRIRKLLDSYSRRLEVSIPREVDELLTSLGAGVTPVILSIPPDPAPIGIEGVVKKFELINLFRRLNISNNDINRKIMGAFGHQNYYEVVVQDSPARNQRRIKQWSFLIPCEQIDGRGFRLGLKVWGDLEAMTVYEEEVFWVATFIDWK